MWVEDHWASRYNIWFCEVSMFRVWKPNWRVLYSHKCIPYYLIIEAPITGNCWHWRGWWWKKQQQRSSIQETKISQVSVCVLSATAIKPKFSCSRPSHRNCGVTRWQIYRIHKQELLLLARCTEFWALRKPVATTGVHLLCTCYIGSSWKDF